MQAVQAERDGSILHRDRSREAVHRARRPQGQLPVPVFPRRVAPNVIGTDAQGDLVADGAQCRQYRVPRMSRPRLDRDLRCPGNLHERIGCDWIDQDAKGEIRIDERLHLYAGPARVGAERDCDRVALAHEARDDLDMQRAVPWARVAFQVEPAGERRAVRRDRGHEIRRGRIVQLWLAHV